MLNLYLRQFVKFSFFSEIGYGNPSASNIVASWMESDMIRNLSRAGVKVFAPGIGMLAFDFGQEVQHQVTNAYEYAENVLKTARPDLPAGWKIRVSHIGFSMGGLVAERVAAKIAALHLGFVVPGCIVTMNSPHGQGLSKALSSNFMSFLGFISSDPAPVEHSELLDDYYKVAVGSVKAESIDTDLSDGVRSSDIFQNGLNAASDGFICLDRQLHYVGQDAMVTDSQLKFLMTLRDHASVYEMLPDGQVGSDWHRLLFVASSKAVDNFHIHILGFSMSRLFLGLNEGSTTVTANLSTFLTQSPGTPLPRMPGCTMIKKHRAIKLLPYLLIIGIPHKGAAEIVAEYQNFMHSFDVSKFKQCLELCGKPTDETRVISVQHTEKSNPSYQLQLPASDGPVFNFSWSKNWNPMAAQFGKLLSKSFNLPEYLFTELGDFVHLTSAAYRSQEREMRAGLMQTLLCTIYTIAYVQQSAVQMDLLSTFIISLIPDGADRNTQAEVIKLFFENPVRPTNVLPPGTVDISRIGDAIKPSSNMQTKVKTEAEASTIQHKPKKANTKRQKADAKQTNQKQQSAAADRNAEVEQVEKQIQIMRDAAKRDAEQMAELRRKLNAEAALRLQKEDELKSQQAKTTAAELHLKYAEAALQETQQDLAKHQLVAEKEKYAADAQKKLHEEELERQQRMLEGTKRDAEQAPSALRREAALRTQLHATETASTEYDASTERAHQQRLLPAEQEQREVVPEDQPQCKACTIQ